MSKKKILFIQFREKKVIAEHEKQCFLRSLGVKEDELEVKNFFQDQKDGLNLLEKSRGVVIGGSGEFSFSDKDTLPELWKKTQKSFPLVKSIIDKGIPVIGLCFGHQLLGYVLGADVVNDKAQEETGSVLITLTDDAKKDPLFNGLPDEFIAQVGHKDVVAELPKGALLLAKSEKCKVQGFKINNVYGLQFHPEMIPSDVKFRLGFYPDYESIQKELNLKESPHAPLILQNFKNEFLS